MSSTVPQAELDSFSAHLKSSTRILALLGAGLSASSGLPTFRGAGGYWRKYDAVSLATPEAFEDDPGLVWQFYNFRRHMALKAAPNRAHYALAELARKKGDFLTISQNVDGPPYAPAQTLKAKRGLTHRQASHNEPNIHKPASSFSTARYSMSNAPTSRVTM